MLSYGERNKRTVCVVYILQKDFCLDENATRRFILAVMEIFQVFSGVSTRVLTDLE